MKGNSGRFNGTNGSPQRAIDFAQGDNALPSDRAQLLHVFRDAPGHLLDTEANRMRLLDLINDKTNLVGVDSFDRAWYAKTTMDGRQLWAYVMDGVLQNGGLNDEPRTWNEDSGFNRPPRRR